MQILRTRKNKNVTVSQLDAILCEVIEAMIPKIVDPLIKKINDQSERLEKLESDLEYERRLRFR